MGQVDNGPKHLTGEPMIVAVVGPTATGKTRRAVTLAKALDGEIVSADSRQVYCDMDLGTGKDLEEYCGVAYHLIDVAEAGDKYNLYRYLADADAAIDSITERGRQPIVCGGTGMYVEALINGLRLPEVPANAVLRASLEGLTLDQLTERLSAMKTLHNVTDVDTCQRAIRAIEIQTYYLEHPEAAVQATPHPRRAAIIGIDVPRDVRRSRITERLHARLDSGMVDEVARLLDRGISPDDLIYYGLEYKFLTLYITGQMSYTEMVDSLEIAIHQFAKRQMTWFRGMERRGHKIHWLPYDMPDDQFIASAVEIINDVSTNA